MRVLVLGRTGQVAKELARQAEAAKITVTCLDRTMADLSDPTACARRLAMYEADAVINAAAWTAVDAAEAQEAEALVINAEAPGAMAKACVVRALPFLHVSTDYVFEGSGTDPWRETDTVAPRNAYGRTKQAGEEAVRAAGGHHAILRTSWVFSAHGTNFVKSMLRLSETRDRLQIVDDQIGGPTPAAGIAYALMIMARAMVAGQGGGTYHYAGQPAVSWAGFAREIFARAGRQVEVVGIPSRDYPTPAVRPQNSRLDCTAIGSDFGIAPPDWRQGLDVVLKELDK